MFSYSIFSYQKLLSFLFVCSLQAFPYICQAKYCCDQEKSRNQDDPPEPVISALSERDSILPQVITSIGRPIPIKLKVASEIIAVLTFITTINMIDEKEVWYQMLPQNTEEPCSHTLCSDDILTVSNLSNLGAYYFRNTGPAGHTDYKRQAEDVRISQIACSKMIRSSVGILKKTSVNRMIISSSHAGATPLKAPTTTAMKVEITVANPPIRIEILPPIPDHGKDISSHGICSKKELRIWSLIIIKKIHISRILCHDQFCSQTAQYDKNQYYC